MDRPEICEVARRTIDNVLGAEIAVIMNTFKVELEADRLFIPLVPTLLVVDEELNKNSIMLLSIRLYPVFYGFSPDGETQPLRNKGLQYKKSLSFTLRK